MALKRGRKFNRVRAEKMAEMFRAGHTLQEIGDEYGVSRERVRQLIKKVGVTGKDGGASKISRDREMLRALAKEWACVRRWGCTRAQLRYLRSLAKTREDSPVGKFCQQRQNARNRGIEWNLTLWEWWQIWEESGKWNQRGRNDGEYVMARYCDEGAYEVGNVRIVTCNENINEYYTVTKPSREELTGT